MLKKNTKTLSVRKILKAFLTRLNTTALRRHVPLRKACQDTLKILDQAKDKKVKNNYI